MRNWKKIEESADKKKSIVFIGADTIGDTPKFIVSRGKARVTCFSLPTAKKLYEGV